MRADVFGVAKLGLIVVAFLVLRRFGCLAYGRSEFEFVIFVLVALGR